jgi:hypothetical protein
MYVLQVFNYILYILYMIEYIFEYKGGTMQI